jgi:hypothetical protein
MKERRVSRTQPSMAREGEKGSSTLLRTRGVGLEGRALRGGEKMVTLVLDVLQADLWNINQALRAGTIF